MNDPDRDQRQLAALRDVIEAAENAGDAASIAALFANDAVVMVPDFPVQEGREACAAFLEGLLPGLLAHFDRRITYASDDVAIDDGRAVDRGTFSFTVQPRTGGVRETVTGKYLWLYVSDAAGGWKLSRMVVSRDEADDGREVHALSTTERALARLALGFAVLLAVVEIARNAGNWGFWAFWVVDYLIVALLVGGWVAVRQAWPNSRAWLAGAWGFTAATFYQSFFLELTQDGDVTRGVMPPGLLLWGKGGLLAVAVVAFVLALVPARVKREVES